MSTGNFRFGGSKAGYMQVDGEVTEVRHRLNTKDGHLQRDHDAPAQYELYTNPAWRKFVAMWDCFALHLWLFTSSYGIVFAILSFLQELELINGLLIHGKWAKGTAALTLGMLFYIFIGLRHLEGGRRHGAASDQWEGEVEAQMSKCG